MEITLETAPARHLTQVLRLKTSAEVLLFNGDGRDYLASLIDADRRQTRLAVLEQTAVESDPVLQLHLGLAISKGERMDFALQKSVELGVSTITPLLTRHGNVRLSAERLDKRLAHWSGVMISACEQSGRRRLPRLNPCSGIEAWLASATGSTGIMLDPAATRTLDTVPSPNGGLSLLIGPEGGLSNEERMRAEALGFLGIRLGPRVLRTETAPMAAIAAAQMLWGDFRGD
jgi:16S rRNA (uracil1498-N3)-methyltransferase